MEENMKKKNLTKRISSLLLALVMVLTIAMAAPVTANAATGTKPADGTVYGQPFNTAISKNHRIPGLVVHNGQLIASADARWDYEKDGGGMDLVVSRSTDGYTWNYTYAGYLGDNGNVWNADSSTLMDPVIISDGSTLYLLADMFPAGYSISSSSTTNTFSQTGTGYNDDGYLLLSANNRSSYGYYLKNGQIYSTGGTVVSGYTVDGWLNLYQNGSYVTNLLFSDSPYQLYPTSYICMMTSGDNGKTWSEPTLLNVKPSGISWMVLGPGSGLATSDGKLAFTAYDGSSIYLIYGSPSTGWNRVRTTAANNESSIIELNDGTIRAFVKRSGSNAVAYVDFYKSGSGYTAGSLVNTGNANFSNCMVSSLHYSKTLNGQEVVLVCCPSKSSGGTWAGRFNGKIYAYTLNSSNAMTLIGTYQINNSFFAYSNMAELADGTIGLLYEDDCISYAAGSYYGTASHISYTNVDLEAVLGVTFDAPAIDEISLTDNTTGITVTAPGLTGLTVSQMTAPSVEDAVDGHVKAWSITASTDEGLYTGSAEVSVPVPAGWTHVEVLGMEGTVKNGYITLNVSSLGNVVIYDRDTRVLVELERGESLTMMDTTGDYASSYTGADLDKTIAQVTVKGVPGVSETTVDSAKATTLENGATYIIRVYNTSYALSSNSGRGDWGTTTRAYEYNALTANTAHMWTLEASGNGYKLKNDAGYLNLGTGNNSAYLNSTGEVFNITYTSTGWTIGNGSVYVNALGGLTWYYSAGGWISDNTRFDFYKVTEKTDATTEITFTGISTGTTYTTVGNTTYKIVVEGGACVHNYAADTQAPTCETAGLTTYTCTLCGEGYTEEIPALGHDYKTVTVEATCETAGSVTTTCATCGDKTVETIPALGHDYKTTTVAATCTTGGYTSHTCATCGKTYTSDETAALGHTYTSKTVEATCETAGGTVYTCTTCGYSYTGNQVAALGHTYKTTTVAATCTTAGSVTKTCATCGDKTVETIPALGHDYETTTVAATCETAGSATKLCTTCGDKTVESIPALGHDYKTVTVAATCEKAGSVTKTCATCGDKTVETIPALGHNYQSTTVAATCTTNGSVTTACANCGDKTVETIPALGHSYTSTTVAPTCTAGGYTYHKCDVCGDSYTSNQTAALGHTYTTQEVDNNLVYTCTHCGHSYSESLAKNYTYDKVTSFASGESYVITLYSGRKYYAVTHSNNTLAVKQVTVSGNKITSEITEDMLWDYNSGKLSYTSGNNTVYLYAKTTYSGWFGWNSTTTLTLSTTNSSTVSFSSSKLKVGSSYLRYNYGSVSLNRSATTSYLFKQNEQ